MLKVSKRYLSKVLDFLSMIPGSFWFFILCLMLLIIYDVAPELVKRILAYNRTSVTQIDLDILEQYGVEARPRINNIITVALSIVIIAGILYAYRIYILVFILGLLALVLSTIITVGVCIAIVKFIKFCWYW